MMPPQRNQEHIEQQTHDHKSHHHTQRSRTTTHPSTGKS